MPAGNVQENQPRVLESLKRNCWISEQRHFPSTREIWQRWC